MDTLKKIFFSLMILVISLSANETQVFTSIVKKIEIDNSSQFKKIFYGEANDFYKNPSKYLNKSTLKAATGATLQIMAGELKALPAISTIGNGAKISDGGLIGLAGIAIFSVGEMGFNWIVSDNEYIYISLVTNTKGEQSLVYTLIVANDSLDDKDGIKLALDDQKILKGSL